MVAPGMKSEVISLHDGFHLDVVQGDSIPPKAVVKFDSGITLMVDERMKWERVDDPFHLECCLWQAQRPALSEQA